jgi:hypothetical protein
MKVAEPQHVYAILDQASSSNYIPSRGFGFLFQMGHSSFYHPDYPTVKWAENVVACCLPPGFPMRKA